jgi:hypothetical protein
MTVKELKAYLNRLGKEYDDYVVTRPKPQWRTRPGFGYVEKYAGDEYVGDEPRPINGAYLKTYNETLNID